jgi:uncharacterized protein with GYD domain
MEGDMATYIILMSWTDQAIRAIKEADLRLNYGRNLAKQFKVQYKDIYMIAGDSDLLAIVESANGENVAQFALALASRGNVRTRTWRAWTEAEYLKLISDLPKADVGPSATGGARRKR